LERCAAGSERLTPEELKAAGIIRDTDGPIKLLGDGTVSRKVTIVVHQVSRGAKAKVEQAGGTVELIGATRE